MSTSEGLPLISLSEIVGPPKLEVSILQGTVYEEERFSPKIAKGLPELCYSVHESTGELIVIKRGECGYYPTDYNTPDKERNVELADRLNEKLGVDMWQRQAMEVGSICGWNVPGADPAKYHQPHSPQMGGMTLG